MTRRSVSYTHLCPNCGKSRYFVRYVDEQGSISFPGNVGKCDHENSCGYHYTPTVSYTHLNQNGNQGRGEIRASHGGEAKRLNQLLLARVERIDSQLAEYNEKHHPIPSE